MESFHLNLPSGSRIAAAFGVFDGVHAGHRSVIGALSKCARAHGALALAVTFDPHPRAVLRRPGIDAPELLIPLAERLRLLREAGADEVAVIPFSAALAELTAEEFLSWLFPPKDLTLAAIAVGTNFHFGRGGTGDVHYLRQYTQDHHIFFEAVPPVALDGGPVSSSRIRRLIGTGLFAEAARLLERPYGLFGTIVHGYRDASGKLDCPTANLEVPVGIIPPDGVYGATCRFTDGKLHPAIVNIGWSPTWKRSGQPRRIEVHLLDFSENCYGRTMELIPVKFLRPEREFPDIASLKEQIQHDVARARSVLGDTGGDDAKNLFRR